MDKAAIASHIRQSLQDQSQVSLYELCQTQPLKQGLAELVAYLELGNEEGSGGRFTLLIDEAIADHIIWTGEDKKKRRVKMPRVLYLRPSSKQQP